jgi:murein endopeptidase
MSHVASRRARGGMHVPIAAFLVLVGVIAAASLSQTRVDHASFAPLARTSEAAAHEADRVVERRSAPLATSTAVAGRSRGAAALPMAPSQALGSTDSGRLAHGMQLPAAGIGFVSWDDLRWRRPDRGWRRFGTDRLIDFLEELGQEWHAAHPAAAPLLIGDLSRTHGGPFGSEFGGLGHASHQKGIDADIYYPRRDQKLIAARTPAQIDHRLAQSLVNMIVAKGVEYAFVGPHTGLTGPHKIVIPLVDHDDHVHVRIRWP